MLLFLSIVLYIFGDSATIFAASFCVNKFPEFEIPDSLEEVFPPLAFWSAKNEYFRDYVVKRGVNQFTINCTSVFPVLWRITLSKAYTSAKVDMYSHELTNGSRENGHCYTSSITFLEVNENLSGLYACESFVTANGALVNRPEYRPLAIYIYSMQDKGAGGIMLNRGRNYTVVPTEDNIGLLQSDMMYLPCNVNTPSTIEATINWQDGGVKKSLELGATVCSNNKNLCLDHQSFLVAQNNASLFINGAHLTCTSNESISDLDSVHLNILPSSNLLYDPVESEMVLEVSEGEIYTFMCKSTKRIALTTNYLYGHQLITNSSLIAKNSYYHAKLRITIPLEDISSLEWLTDGVRRWKEIDLEVNCTQENNPNVQKTWKYILNIASHIDRDPNSDKVEYNTITVLENTVFPYQHLVCRTPAPRTLKVYIVGCSTITECQMKAPLLSNESYIEDEDYLMFGSQSVLFHLEQGKSAMVRCVGFQIDIMSYFYVGLDPHRPHYKLSSSLRLASKSETSNPLISLNVSDIFAKEAVDVICRSPLMTLASPSILQFNFRNSTSGIIYPHYILENKFANENESNTVFATILIPTIDVIGITCKNLQYLTLSPLFWKDGVLLKNADYYSLVWKEKAANLNVTDRLVKMDGSNDKAGIYVGIAFGILFLTGILTSVYYYNRFQAQKKLLEEISEEEIEIFMRGRPEFISANETSNTNAQHLPFEPKFDIDPLTLEIDYQDRLGSGEFGIVYKGLLKLEEIMAVAVKALKPGSTGNNVRSAMAELKVMLFIGDHENIVKVIGACTNELRNNKLHVVMEFCENQSLLTYLRSNTEFFFNQVQRGVYYEDLTDGGDYACFMKTSDLIRWSFQISNGMNHVSDLKVIHGDLATRNVLLDKNFIAKVSDFGLSRKLYDLPAYVRKTTRDVKIPWRWCALESLLQQEFSLASDVWSFGVTLWEIFSLGVAPYPGFEYGHQFITMLTDGFRMSMPEYSSCEIYNIMMDCWRKEPTNRPKFAELKERLAEMSTCSGLEISNNLLPSKQIKTDALEPTSYDLSSIHYTRISRYQKNNSDDTIL